MKAIIVDDEIFAQESLRMKLIDFGVEIIGVFDNGVSFLDQISTLEADVVFMDIEMPVMTGFNILESLLEIKENLYIIFVTAHRDYAAEAFETNALDYIVKPVTYQRLEKALSRVPLNNMTLHENKHKDGDHASLVDTPNSRIEIRCLGPFSIIINGQEFSKSWRTKKTEEMLSYLICQKGSYVSKESLAELLWPDSDGTRSKANLHVAYHYLKQYEKVLGITLPIESVRTSIRFVIDQVSLDIHKFDQLYEQIEKAISDNQYDQNETIMSESVVGWMEEAASLYRGDFLQGRYYSWMSSYMSFYEMRYERLLHLLIQHFDNEKSIKKQTYYQNCLSQLLG